MRLKPVAAKDGISVLYGHRVLPTRPTGIGPYAQTTITSDFLDEFLRIHADWQALSIHDIQSGNYHDDTPAYALTFDDGYRDNLTHLLPVLEGHDVPVTIFICDQFCHGDLQPFEHQLASRSDDKSIYDRTRHQLKNGTLRHRQSKLNRLIRQYDLPVDIDNPTSFLNAGDIAVMADHPLITIGHHTKTHPLLSRMMPWHVWNELKSDKDIIAYPYGGQNFMVRAIANAQGYRCGFTTENRLYNPARDNPLAIPRIALKMD